MEELLQRVLEFNHVVILMIIFIIAFMPASVVIFIKNAKPWVKLLTVLLPGELAALALWMLASAAEKGVGGLLAQCKILAVVMGVLVLVCAVANHLSKWKLRTWKK